MKIIVEVINKDFSLEKFNEIKIIHRANQDKYGMLFIGDRFECTEDMADYLSGNNKLNKCFIKVLEVIPEETKAVEEVKPTVKKTTTKKTTKK